MSFHQGIENLSAVAAVSYRLKALVDEAVEIEAFSMEIVRSKNDKDMVEHLSDKVRYWEIR